MEKKFVSVVVYLHNDEPNIEEFMNEVVLKVKNHFEHFELICVDDDCTDNSINLLKKKADEQGISEIITIVHMGFFQGLEASMNAGRDVSIGDFIYEFDTPYVDYDSEVVVDIYEKMLSGYDIVSASGESRISLTSRLFYNSFNRYSNSNAKIGPETFRIVSRRAVNRIKSMGKYIPYRKAVYANCGLEMTTVKYSIKGDARRAKKGFSPERNALAMDSFIYFTSIMEKLSAVICGIFLLSSVCMGIYSLVDYFVEDALAVGWTSTMLFMSLGFFGVFLLLTIILKYMSVMLDLIFRQQKYLVSNIEKISN